MGVAERRERERAELRRQIIDAARDLLVEQGLPGLSMRAIAERVEYSPATIYLYFRDKHELVDEVVHTGFGMLAETVEAELVRTGETASAIDQYGAMGRAYARFAVENPAYFRVMFELPGTAEHSCDPVVESPADFEAAVAMVRRAVEAGEVDAVDPRRMALMGWGLVHGLTTLFLSGHLSTEIRSTDDFMDLIEDAMKSIYTGWKPGAPGAEAT
ncbi:MAG TPA: TetR/AcrR family transcriptional regulator [Longimicrobiales bacterium]|nr:TetR/AcrR family transcriptional regulator [Longimicrobiales bacterium]